MVVHIITRLAMGGAQQQAFEIVKRMHQSGKDVIIFTGLSDMKKSLSAKDNKILNLIKNDNIPVEIIPTLNDRISLLNDFKSLIRIYFLIKKYNPSVVHIHSSKTGILGRLASVFLNIKKIIYHVHGWSFSSSTGLNQKLYLFLEKTFYYITTDYIFVCEQDMIDFIDLGGNKNIKNKSHVIYPGCDFNDIKSIEKTKKSLRNKFGISNKDHLIGTVARLDFQKNPQIFVEIANKYLKKDSNAKFMWIGKGGSLIEVKKLIHKYGISDKFILPGFVDDIEPYFSIFDTFVLTSRYEGLPVTILKGLACEIPIVSFQINGVNDLSKQFKSVYGTKPFVIDDFVENLILAKKIINESPELIKNEAMVIRKKFNMNMMYNNILRVYEKNI
jgi:glycosyltransferase involved in cell wall biosynthesis